MDVRPIRRKAPGISFGHARRGQQEFSISMGKTSALTRSLTPMISRTAAPSRVADDESKSKMKFPKEQNQSPFVSLERLQPVRM